MREDYLERGDKSTIKTVGEVSLGFKPLIGAEVVIDVIGAAIAIAAYATTANPAAARIINNFRGKLSKLGASITFTATFYGELEIEMDFLKINSTSKNKVDGKTTIGGKMGVTISFGISLEIGKAKGKNIKPINISFKAEASADAYFGGDFIIDSDKKGLFIQPILKFSGVMLIIDIEGEVGWWKCNFKVEEKIIDKDEYYLEKTYF